MDFYEEFEDEKKHKEGAREHHRWTEAETIKLLQCIATMLKEPNIQYERPTARVFYEEMKLKYFSECNLTNNVLKSKMRHLKASYLKAVDWKDTVGMQLYDSDQEHVRTRIRSICPHYNLLDEIFGPISNSDPIGFRLPDAQIDEKTATDSIYKSAKKARIVNSMPLVVPKTEAFNDEQYDFEDQSLDTINNEYEDIYNESQPSNETLVNCNKKINATNIKRNNIKAYNISLEERTFQFEKQKFQLNYRLQSRRIALDEKKLKFEREKFEKLQKMRKYEIDKQYAIKKQEIESNERLKRLELGKSAEPVSTEVGVLAYEHDVTEDEACSEFIE